VIRVFGTKNCDDCNLIMACLDNALVDYEYVDALSEDLEIEKICDIYEVDDLPHIQILNKNGKVIKEFIGIEDSINNFGKIIDK